MATPSAASAGDGSFFVERRHFFELLAQAVACRDAMLLEPIVKRMGEIVSGGAGGGRRWRRRAAAGGGARARWRISRKSRVAGICAHRKPASYSSNS